MSKVTLGNTRVENTVFNDRLQLSRVRLGTSANTGVCGTGGDEWCVDITYGSTAASNIGNLSEQTMFARKPDNSFLSIKTAYQYDGVNRLTTTTETVLAGGASGNWSQTNHYDRWGNRWADATISQTDMTPLALNRIDTANNRVILAKLSLTGTQRAISFDFAGNMIAHPDLLSGGALKYDAENRLVSAGSTVYTYDGEGRRVKKFGTALTYFIRWFWPVSV